MKRIHQIIRSGGVTTTLAIAAALCITSAQAGEAKPFKETFTEFVVTLLNPGGAASVLLSGGPGALWHGGMVGRGPAIHP